MHTFTELIDRCTAFTLKVLREANERTIEELETSAATTLVKTLQMIQLQKAVFAVGMFSMFEADLQESLSCIDGFREAEEILDREGEANLKERFTNLQLAINTLKHGSGRSYNALVKKKSSLAFRVKLPDEGFFFEGDVSEVDTLVEVDDAFVLECVAVIQDVSEVINRARK